MLFWVNSAYSQTVFEDWMTTRGTQSYFLKSVVKTDANKNVYQAGATLSSLGDYDVILTKYNPRGEELWTETYDVAGYDDAAIDLFIDNNNNVYLAGSTFNPSNSGYQVLVLKYSSSGTFLWDDVYTYPNSLYNLATSITGDNNRIYVGGATYNLTNQADYLALSYTHSGSMNWNYSWNNVDYNDVITKIYPSGNSISLAGGTQTDPNSWKYSIVNLDASTGSFQNQTTSGGTGDGIDRITDLTRDGAGNIYVTGGALNNTGYDFRTIKLDNALNITWSVNYNSSGSFNDIANALAVDPSGNVYVTGYSESADNGTNYTTLKYNSSGSQLWAASYNGKANAADTANAIVLDASNQPIITGVSENTANEDFHTIKYSTSGNELWNITYNGVTNGRDNPFDIAIDNAGDVIVAGQSEIGGIYRYTSVKYIERNIVNPPDEENIPSSGYFTENNGQLVKTNGQQASDIKFIGGADYPKVYVQDDKLSYVFHVADSLANDTLHRIDMVFNERKKNPKMRALDKMDFYQNYYLPTVADGKRERVESFKKLISLDVWDNIDLMISHNNKGLKYYLICKPGFSTADLGWKYEGASSVSVNSSGELVLTSSIGFVIMPKGEAYEVNSSGTRIDKSWQPTFSVSGSDASLGIGSFNANNTLVIEIDKGVVQGTGGVASIGNMLWNSHYGSGSESHFNDVVTDSNGQIYICGGTKAGNFPVLIGQQVLADYSGGLDVILLKLNADIVPQWSSYFGGSENANGYAGNDNVKAIALRRFVQDAVLNDVYICGYTNSVDMTIANSGGNADVDPTNNCSSGLCLDGFIAQFDLNGTLHWSTYYGNDGDETLRDIEVDNLGNIYAVGSRNTNTTIVPKSGASNYFSGSGLFLKYNVNKNLEWSNPWDGEVIMSLDIDSDNNVYTTGGTKSDNMPVMNTDPGLPTTTSLYSTGKLDAFVNKFDANGQLQFSSYFGGHCPEAGNSIVVDDNDNIYFAGNTRAEIPDYTCVDNMPLINSISPNSNGYSDFLVKINLSSAAADFLFSSYIGGSNIDGAFPIVVGEPLDYMRVKLAVSNSGILYLTTYSRSGYSQNQFGMPLPTNQPDGFYVKDNLTISANEPNVNLGDNYIAAFNQNMQLIWATYHGSNKYDYCGGVAISENNDRVVVVGTGNHGLNEMDLNTYDGVDYNPSVINDYYQPYIISETTPCAQGVIFGVSEIDIPLSNKHFLESAYKIKLWPNPSSNQLAVSFSKTIQKIEIFDVSGKLVQALTPNSSMFYIDTSLLSAGIFIIKISSEDYVFNEKFIKL
ncbi:T9SS type A sorting domain-containing protein [Cryomorpha ignava]|uniref:T9SS type A sorting domain-containing protein n=1 Tax=Cryomorpha ignava TaxID=101383 RepID=A0A7K3WM28_9FLAO|nr:SBBP repeat-containing protein [Cryomorpha ignava]NEN22578.1 T9SS type A sorting domain-containing protein [Cryomorpha ignava]